MSEALIVSVVYYPDDYTFLDVQFLFYMKFPGIH